MEAIRLQSQIYKIFQTEGGLQGHLIQIHSQYAKYFLIINPLTLKPVEILSFMCCYYYAVLQRAPRKIHTLYMYPNSFSQIQSRDKIPQSAIHSWLIILSIYYRLSCCLLERWWQLMNFPTSCEWVFYHICS